MSGGTFSPVPDEVISGIKSREGPDGFVKVDEAERLQLHRRFIRGQLVRANLGPFVGLHGTVEKTFGATAIVEFEFLGRKVPVAMRTDDLTAEERQQRRRRYRRSRSVGTSAA
jgi:transcription antitermination factor NusG